MSYIKIGSKQHHRAAIGMLLGSVVTFATMYSPQPLISLFTEEYGISPALASASISITTMALAIALLFVSRLSNLWGRKGMMSLSLLLSSGFAIASAFVDNYYIFLVLRLLQGVSIAGFPSIAMAYLNEEFSPESIGKVVGVYVAGTSLGGLIGRVVVGAMTDLTNWKTALILLGVVNLVLSLWFWRNLPESGNFTRKRESAVQWLSSMKQAFLNRDLLRIYLTGFLLMGVYISILDYIGYILLEAPYNLSQTIFGFLFVVNLAGTASSILFGKLTDRYSRRSVIALAMGVLLAGMILTMVGGLWVKIAGVALVAFGFFAGHSVASGWVGILASKNIKAQASSIYLLFYYGGSSLIGMSGGFFLSHFGWNGLIIYLGFLLIAAAGIAVSAHDVRARVPSRTGAAAGAVARDSRPVISKKTTFHVR